MLVAQHVDEKIITADSLSEIEKFEQSNDLYKSILSELDSNDKKYNEIATKLAIGYQKIELHQKAIDLLSPLLSGSSVTQDSITALAFHKLAVSHYYLEEDRKAITFWLKAIQIREEIVTTDLSDIIKGYRNIGTTYINLEEYLSAKEFMQNALDLLIRQKPQDEVLLALTYAELGHTLSVLGDFGQSETYLLKAKDLYETIFNEEPWEMYLIYTYLYEHYHLLGNMDLALAYPKRIIDLVNNLDDLYLADSIALADAYNNLSNGQQLSANWNGSINSLQRSIDINKAIGKNRMRELAINYNNLSISHHKLNKINEAKDYINRSISINKSIKDPMSLAGDYINKADIYFASDEKDEALAYSAKSFQLLKSSQSELEYINNPILIDAFATKIKILTQGSIDFENTLIQQETMLTIDDALKYFDQIRQSYLNEQSKRVLSKSIKEVINLSMDYYYLTYKYLDDDEYLVKAFLLSEKAKSISLLDALQSAQLRVNLQDPVLAKGRLLKKQLSELERDRYFNDANIDHELIAKRRALEIFQDSIDRIVDAELKTEHQDLLSISSIKDLIGGNTIIDYHLTDSTIYIITFNQGGMTFSAISKPPRLKTIIQQLRDGIYYPKLNRLTSDDELDKYDRLYVESALSLYDLLIRPVLNTTDSIKNLIIVPDEELGYIPFDVLLSEKPQSNFSYNTHQYLINDFTISYTYSLGLLYEMVSKDITARRACLAVAPFFDGSFSQDRSFTLSRLDHNKSEVQSVIEIIGGKSLEWSEATEQAFTDEVENYTIIHLATHGKANDLDGDFAYLAFTHLDDDIENEFLYNTEIYNLELNADMVVLSACETGVGELNQGEGIISLARGFSYAGAKSIITTLWSINDARTKEIMEDFYQYINEGRRKDDALREAKLGFIKQNGRRAHPFYWAAFVPIGDMEAINLKNSFPFIPTLIFITIIIAAALLYQLKRRNKR